MRTKSAITFAASVAAAFAPFLVAQAPPAHAINCPPGWVVRVGLGFVDCQPATGQQPSPSPQTAANPAPAPQQPAQPPPAQQPAPAPAAPAPTQPADAAPPPVNAAPPVVAPGGGCADPAWAAEHNLDCAMFGNVSASVPAGQPGQPPVNINPSAAPSNADPNALAQGIAGAEAALGNAGAGDQPATPSDQVASSGGQDGPSAEGCGGTSELPCPQQVGDNTDNTASDNTPPAKPADTQQKTCPDGWNPGPDGKCPGDLTGAGNDQSSLPDSTKQFNNPQQQSQQGTTPATEGQQTQPVFGNDSNTKPAPAPNLGGTGNSPVCNIIGC